MCAMNPPAIMTTDQSSCTKGYVKTTSASTNAVNTVFGGSGHSKNSNCNYSSTFNGTSSAALVTSVAVALILEANPSLTWRDVKHILAGTSDQVDASISIKKLPLTVLYTLQNQLSLPIMLAINFIIIMLLAGLM